MPAELRKAQIPIVVPDGDDVVARVDLGTKLLRRLRELAHAMIALLQIEPGST